MKKIISSLILIMFSFICQAQISLPKVDAINKRLIFNSQNHLKDFIDFYSKDDSEDALDKIVIDLEKKGFESLLNVEKRIAYLQSKDITISDDIEDDILIGDDRLACLLNNERHIVVGGQLFKYVEDGLYFTKKINSNIEQKIQAKKNLKKSFASFPKETINNETIYNLGDDLKFFSYQYKKSVDYNDNYNVSNDSTDKSFASNDPYGPPYTLKNCNLDSSGFFESIFPGNSEVCINNINSKKRIRTKFSSQNYYLFSSVYAKVKSQKRTKVLGVEFWNKDNFCEYLEMGRTVVLKFPVEYPSPPVFTNSFLIRDNNVNRVIDINGNTTYSNLQGLTNVFEQFPFDEGSFNYEIYYYLGSYDPKPKDINKLIAKGLKGLLKGLGKSFDDLFGEGKNTTVGMTFDSPDGIYIAEYGERERKYRRSKISKTYDWNVEIKFKSSAEDFFSDLVKNINPGTFLNAKTYEVTVLDVYGFGNYNGFIYGSRIFKGDLEERNTNGIDSDADGVPDHEDLCRFQKGIPKYAGCPYSLIDQQALYANRVNEIHNQTNSKTSNDSFHTIGACYNLAIRSSDYPSIINKVKGGHYKKYDIVAGKEITIDGRSNVHIKPEGNTESITLKIQENACDITQPQRLQKTTIITKNNQKNLKKENYINKPHSLILFPNPVSNTLHVQDVNDISSWRIADKFGNTILSDKNTNATTIKINTSSLTQGMYFLTIISNNGNVAIKKIIKNE